MGWDIIAIGTNHNLPIEDPTATAKRLLPLCPGPVSIGHFSDWEYDPKENLIRRLSSTWKEEALLCGEKEGETVKFIIENACALSIYENLGKRFHEVNFISRDDKISFLSYIKNRYALFELYNDKTWYPDNRIFQEIAEFSINFPGRWFQFLDLFRKPYEGDAKGILDKFRWDIYRQMRLCGCDKAYFFPDQNYGEWIYDNINLPSKEWVEYLMSGRHLEKSTKNKEIIVPLRILNIVDYVVGRIVLEEEDYIHCFIDDFSDFE